MNFGKFGSQAAGSKSSHAGRPRGNSGVASSSNYSEDEFESASQSKSFALGQSSNTNTLS